MMQRGAQLGSGVRVHTLRPLLALVLASCAASPPAAAGGSPSMRTDTPSSTSVVMPSVAESLEGPPTRCAGPIPEPRVVSRAYGALVGEELAYAGFYARYEAPDGFHASDAPRTRFGYRIKALWVMPSAQRDRVTVSGQSDSGASLWFGLEDSRPSTRLILDPATTDASFDNPRWREFHTYLYFPAAACYLLEVTGDGAGWTAGIGMGR
jgi:hypothetical protein